MDEINPSDTTPSRLRNQKRKSSPRSIDHGSSDYHQNNNTKNNNNNGDSSSSIINLTHSNSSLLAGNRDDSPNEGLHHRHPHKLQELSSHNYYESNSNNNGGLFRRPAMPVFHHPSNSKLSSVKSGGSRQSTKNIRGWILQYSIPLIVVLGFFVSCLYGHNYYMAKYNVDKSRRDEEQHQEERWKEMLKDTASFGRGHGGDSGLVSSNHVSLDSKSQTKSKSKFKGSSTITRGKRKMMRSSTFARRVLHSYSRQSDSSSSSNRHTKDSNFVSFGFDPKQKVFYEQPTEQTAAYQRAEHWHTSQLQTHAQIVNKQTEARRKRTGGGLSNSNGISSVDHSNNLDLESIGAIKTNSGLLPLWYELNHLTKETMQALHHRWKRDDETTIRQAATNPNELRKDFNLCGIHAQTAAQIHPQNYYPSNSTTNFNSHHAPLGPSSRVLITGILSPLGMHLAIALSRQCNVTNFLGIDTQMPNDPLSRLEQEDRLAVLMEELVDLKSLQVPFLGVQSKQRGKRSPRQEAEVKAREDALIHLYLHGTLNEYTNLPKEYLTPHTLYGIPNSPGIHPDGHGALEILLEYRPTHVVHLAGTQSESFTSAKDVDYVYPGRDENDIILKESISTKPHLYDLRMGGASMEQLLSAIVAQGMLPPRYGRDYGEDHSEEDEEEAKKLSSDDLNKMKRPHFVYASSHDAGYFGDLAWRVNHRGESSEGSEGYSNGNNGDEQRKEDLATSPLTLQAPSRGLNGVSRLIDEVLASTYYALYGVSSVGLRFDAIYGPRGFGVPSTSVPIYNVHRIRRGGVSSDVDLAETAVRRLYRNWVKVVKEEEDNEETNTNAAKTDTDTSLIEEAGWSRAAHDPRDFVFVEDAVGAIIAAMQYRVVGDSPSSFSIGSGEMSTLSTLSSDIEEVSSEDGVSAIGKHAFMKSVLDVELSSAARSASLDSKEYLQWSSTTTMQDGAAKTLAWHLDRALPFFPPSNDGSLLLDGEDILSRRGITSCLPNRGQTCLRESPVIPCSSECSTKTCVPSVFDSVLELSRDVTEDCEAVLYTTSLGYDAKKLQLQTQYSDGQEQKKQNDAALCTIAFVPTESRLVQSVIDKVPPDSLKTMNLGLSENSDYQTKLKKLNGHLVHQGWLLIFVDGAAEPLAAEDIFMPKLSPRRLFHPSVRRAMFVDENFSSTPMPEDALFLASEMSRGKIKKRTVMGPNEHGKKIKYKLPEEPPRTAVMMVAPMRNMPNVDAQPVPLREITKNLLKEVGSNEEHSEPKEVRVQREFYEKARTLINSFDMRSLDDNALHKIYMKDFIRSRWVLHDLKEEEGHQLRCEWYREHVRWNTHLDQLSFAYVMAKRELTRKVITEQPLKTEVEKKTLLQMVIDSKSDAKEWHPIFSGEGATLPIHHSQMAPEAIPQNLQDQYVITEDAPESSVDDGSNTFYVRIMSDERMVEARKAWSKARQARLQQNKGLNLSPNLSPEERRKIEEAVEREKNRH